MEPTHTPSLPQEDRRGSSQAALQPRLRLPPRLAASLPSQSPPPALGRWPTAGSSFTVLNATVAVPLPPQLPQSSGGIAGDPSSSHLVNHPVVNLVRPTAWYLQTPASAQSALRSLPMNEPSTSGQSIPINTMPPSALQQSLIRTTSTCRHTNPMSRFTDPAIESLMAGYRRRLWDLAPLPVSREVRESRRRPDIQGTRCGCNGGQAHSEGKASTAAANGNTGSSRAMQSPIGELRSIRHGSNAAQTGNAESSDMGLMFRNASSARGSAGDDEKRKMSPDRLHQESRDIDAPLDLSLKRTSASKRDKSSARQQQNQGAQPSAILNPAIGRQVVGRVPATQILTSGQSTSQKRPSLPNSVKKRAQKFPEPYAPPEAPNPVAAATTTDAAASSSRSNNSSSAKFTCPICHESLRSNDNLKTHLRVHTGERPYVCAVCGADFSDRSSHAKHVNIHTGQREYACDLCERKFTQSGNLARHKKTVHGVGGGGK